MEALAQKLGLSLEAPEFCQFLFAQHREQIGTGGVRAGKSTAGAMRLATEARIKVMLQQAALYWIIGPDYPQTREEFRYLREWSQKLGIYESSSEPQDGPRVLQLKGGVRIETKSAMYPERLGSVAPDGILVAEAGQCSEEVRRICQERSMEKAAWVLYTGTLENSMEKPSYAWFTELATEWEADRTLAHGSYRLPSWINTTLYGSCLEHIQNDPSMAEYCPDADHGPAHSGQNHPAIIKAKDDLPDYVFAIRIAGEPAGVPFQVYRQLEDEDAVRLLPFNGGPQVNVFGGIDYGTVHPSTLSVVTFHPNPVYVPGGFKEIAWLRETCMRETDPGDVRWLRETREYLSKKWRIPDLHWMVDPNEKFMADSFMGKAVSGTAGSREYRMGLLGSRLTAKAFLFDSTGPGVPGTHEEMRGVHRIKTRSGELVLRRDKDDRSASVENCIEGADGRMLHDLPGVFKIGYNAYKRGMSRVREFNGA